MTQTRITANGLDYILGTDALAGAGNGGWYRCGPGQVLISATGSATAATLQVQRSANDPNDPVYGAQPVNIGAAVTGDPATGGVAIQSNNEAGVGWWRGVISSVTGSQVIVQVSARDAL